MKRTQLRHKYVKLGSNKSKSIYPRQKSYCKSFISKSEKEFYANLNKEDITDNKKFWKTGKPLFSSKSKSRNTIALIEIKNTEVNNSKVAVIVNNSLEIL